jgi:preprotein translocase subunit SecA
VQRTDLPDMIFTNTRVKTSALIAEIKRVHTTGQPVLVGTASVKESQKIASLLKQQGIAHTLLNAKNPHEQAELLARAGMPGSITVSTHMAGRGTDIRLGGKNGTYRQASLSLGGLYVIGTGRHFSVRVDNQLRGRCGRQGDPGLSRFFISLQDKMISRYGIHEFIPRNFFSGCNMHPVTHPKVIKEIARAQSIIEDHHAFMRHTLQRYNILIERERRLVQRIRRQALLHARLPERLRKRCVYWPETAHTGIAKKKRVRFTVKILLHFLDRFWADHLAYSEDLKQGLHLHAIAREEPLLVFIKQVSTRFEQGLEQVFKKTEQFFASRKTNRKTDISLQHPSRPEAAWAYVINDYPLPIYKVERSTGRGLILALSGKLGTLFQKAGAGVMNTIRCLMKK